MKDHMILTMQTPEPDSTTGTIALTCSCLGWVTFGLLAIPGVIIGHTLKASGQATSMVKATLRVGYAAIASALALGITQAILVYRASERIFRLGIGGPTIADLNNHKLYFLFNPDNGPAFAARSSYYAPVFREIFALLGITIVVVAVAIYALRHLKRTTERRQTSRILKENRQR